MSVQKKILFVLLSIILSSCTATPDIHLRIPGTSMEINKPAQLAIGLAVSSKNDQLLVGSGKFVYDLWDIGKGRKLKSFDMGTGSIKVAGSFLAVDVDFFKDGKRALLRSAKKTIIVDIETGRIVKELTGALGRMAVSPDTGLALVIESKRFKPTLIDLERGEVIRELEGHGSGIFGRIVLCVDISPDGKYGLSAGFDSTVRLWDLETGKELRRFIGHTGRGWAGAVNSVKFSPDGRYALSAGSDKTLRLWDVETGKLIRTFTGHTDGIYHATFSSNGKLALSSCVDATVRLWDVSTGKTLKVFKGHSEGFKSGIGSRGVTSVAFTSDDRYALSVGDASLRIWDIASGLEVAMMISFEDEEWLVITPEGYYNSSSNGHKYMQLLRGEKAYSMEQFYDVFYRPDIVAAKLRGEDVSGLVTITMDDAIKNPPPVVEFSSKLTETDKPKVNFCYRVKSTGGGIGEVRLFHNGKLIHSDGYYKVMAKSSSEKMQLAALNSRSIYEDMRAISIKGKKGTFPISSKSKGDVFEDCI
jgi:WD40 repeat protein